MTVVFCDLVGSTELGDRLDAEALRWVIARYYRLMRSVIERHGGTVEKFVGDAVMAAFGVPMLHEDDPLRGCAAAIAMRDGLAALNEELDAIHGVTLECRIGVNTGEVLAGDVATGQAFVTGDTVNIAARLEQNAAPGEILIGKATVGLAGSRLETEPVDPLEVKGKRLPLEAWRLVGVRHDADHVHEQSPLVGREQELERLGVVLDETIRRRAARVVTLLGEPGIGKTRLVAEFTAMAADRARIAHGRCLPYGDATTFVPVIEAVRDALGLAAVTDADDVRRTVLDLFRSDDAERGAAGAIAALLGVGLHEDVDTAWAVRRCLEALARVRPLIMVFDDVHWAEPALVELITDIERRAVDAPILLLCLARRDLAERQGWGATSDDVIALSSLSEGDAGRLLAQLIGNGEVGEDEREQVLSRAGGNPLFLEELAAMLRRRGAEGNESMALPPTLSAVLSARLDGLTEEERAVLQRASVIGEVFDRAAIEDTTEFDRRADVRGCLLGLAEAGFIKTESASSPGQESYRFRHVLIRDVAYASLPKEVRSELHERFADWLQRVGGDHAAEREEVLAYHLEQAHRLLEQLARIDPRTESLAARAGERLISVGERTIRRGDLLGGVRVLERATALLAPTDPRRSAGAFVLAQALASLGEVGPADRLLEETIKHAHAAGDEAAEQHGLVTLARGAWLDDPGRFRVDNLLERGRRAVEVLTPLADRRALCESHFLLADLHWSRGEMTAALAESEAALSFAPFAGPGQFGNAIWYVAYCLLPGPVRLGELLERFKELRERCGEAAAADAAVALAERRALAMLGRFDDAAASASSLRSVLEDLRHRWGLAWADEADAEAALLAGDAPGAEPGARAAVESWRAMGIKANLTYALLLLGDVLIGQKRNDEAQEPIAQARDISGQSEVELQAGWRRLSAKLASRRGDHDAARSLIGEARHILEPTELVVARGRVLLTQAEIFAAAKEAQGAAEAGRQAQMAFEAKEMWPLVEKAERLLSTVAP